MNRTFRSIHPARAALRPVIARPAMIVFAAAGLIARSTSAVDTKVFVHDSYEDFAQGELKSTSLSNRGQISRAPVKTRRASLDESIVFCLEAGPKDTVFVGTGDKGAIFFLGRNDAVTTLCRLREPLVTALALDAKGRLFAAGAPGGNIYQIHADDPGATPTLFCETRQRYVWDLLPGEKGGLIAATGADGLILDISDKGTSSVLLDTDTENVMALLRTRDQRLLAITQAKARIYHVKGRDSATVLYEGKLDEMRSIVEDAEGALCVALNDKSSARRALMTGPMSLPILLGSNTPPPAPSMDRAQEPPPPTGENKPSAPIPASVPTPAVSSLGPAAGSILVRIDRDGFASLLWKAVDTPIHSLALAADGRTILAAAGYKGVLYAIKPNEDYLALFALEKASPVTLLSHDKKVVIGTANAAEVYELLPRLEAKAEYESPAIDAGFPSSWGALRFQGALTDNRTIRVSARVGSTNDPDDNLWLPWTEEVFIKSGRASLSLPVARYLQYRIVFSDNTNNPDFVEKVEAYFGHSNRPPIIKHIRIEPVAAAKTPAPPLPSPDKGPAPGSNPAAIRLMSSQSSPKQKVSSVSADAFSNSGEKKISWDVSDINEDVLTTEAYFKAEDEKVWKLIEKGIKGKETKLITKTIPDGLYRIRLVVSDRPSNSMEKHATAELISNVFTIDNTPPVIDSISVKSESKQCRVTFSVHDELSNIASIRISIDSGDWETVLPADNLLDSLKEKVSTILKIENNGEHNIAILVTDAEGNTRVDRSVFED